MSGLTQGTIPALAAGLIALALTVAAHCGDLPLLSGGELPGLTVARTDTYEGSALYGYIDGGAELYREYGFLRLAVQRLEYRGEELTSEIYRMSDPLAAFGIFSVHRFAARAVDSLGSASCSTAYHAQFAEAEFFVRVVNSTGTAAAAGATLEVARVLRGRVSPAGESLPLSPLLHDLSPGLQHHSYVRGTIGLQNAIPDWGDLLEGVEQAEMFMVSLDAGRTTVADLRLRDPSQGPTVMGRWKDGSARNRAVWTLGQSRLILLEAEAHGDSLRRAVDAAVSRAGRDR